MSSVQKVNLEPLTSVLKIEIRHSPLNDQTLVDPTNSATGLYDGEWVTYNASGLFVRASAIGTPGDPAVTLSWPVWAERGRSDLQAMSTRGCPVWFMGEYEAETRIFDATAVVGSGAAITTMLQPLKVATITFGGRNFSGLVGSALNDNAPVVGYVTKLPSQNGGRLRFIRGWAVRNGTT